jgi:tetratricopeptide (TPR) repeat protein
LRANLAHALLTEGLILGKADAEPSLGRYHEALAPIQRGVEIAEDLASKDSSDYMSRHTLADMGVQFANILRDEDPRKALAVYDHALARLSEVKPDANSQLAMADLLAASSYPARWTGRSEDAKRRIQAASQLLRDAHMYPTDKVEPMSEADDALQAQADDYAEACQIVKAVAAYQELLAKLMAWKPDDGGQLLPGSFIFPVIPLKSLPPLFSSPPPYQQLLASLVVVNPWGAYGSINSASSALSELATGTLRSAGVSLEGRLLCPRRANRMIRKEHLSREF